MIEIAELDGMSRSDVARVKAFMSRQTDRFRPPYGERPIESGRQCVFAGSVNHSTYLRDETGGRRFWPVLCRAPEIDVDGITEVRDQLWAEAATLYFDGKPWWLDSRDLNAAAAQEQADRYEDDPGQKRSPTGSHGGMRSPSRKSWNSASRRNGTNGRSKTRTELHAFCGRGDGSASMTVQRTHGSGDIAAVPSPDDVPGRVPLLPCVYQ